MGCGGCRGSFSFKAPDKESLVAPVMDSDGSILFPKDYTVPVIEGYHLDEENEQRLIPDDDCHCAWKITGIMLQKDGSYRPHHVCRHSKCEHRSKPVTPDVCKGCPLRDAGDAPS